MPFLVTYHYQSNKYPAQRNYAYDVTHDVVTWVNNMQDYKDGTYILINVLEIDERTMANWDGTLKGM